MAKPKFTDGTLIYGCLELFGVDKIEINHIIHIGEHDNNLWKNPIQESAPYKWIILSYINQKDLLSLKKLMHWLGFYLGVHITEYLI